MVFFLVLMILIVTPITYVYLKNTNTTIKDAITSFLKKKGIIEYESINCKGEWSEWNKCSEECINEETEEEKPTTSRTYEISELEVHGGECPLRNVVQTSNCPFEYCPVDCKGEWSEWNKCSEDCITETDEKPTISRNYEITELEKHGGGCPLRDKIETSNCPFEYCPVDCKGEWSEWANCSEDCVNEETDEKPTTSRNYVTTELEKHGGECPLGGKIETSNCPFEYCPIDCKGGWSEWAECSEDCINETDEKPTTSRTYDITELEKHGGECPLGGNIETSNCPFEYCPIDCKGGWSEWNKCSEDCINITDEKPTSSRTYDITELEKHGGECPLRDTIETSNCPFEYCPIDCEGQWGDWTVCSSNCGVKTQTSRQYIVNKQAQFGGTECPTTETSNCPFINCPIDCEGLWGGWVPCSNACGVEQKTSRKHYVFKNAQFGGKCLSTETSNCPFTNCPIDCEGQWSGWAACSNECDVQQQITRKYYVSKNAQFGGTECLYTDKQTETSNCPFTNCPIDCEGQWSGWASCSNECDVQQQITRKYTVNKEAQFGGTMCSYTNGKTETSNCPFTNCPIDCEGVWSLWSPCSNNACGVEQTILRKHYISKKAQFGGTECSYTDRQTETSNCPFTNCPVDCEGNWGDWVGCSNACGVEQTTTRQYIVDKETQFGGTECLYTDKQTETSNCPFTNCPVDCEGQWDNWVACSNNACGVEQKTTRQYTVNTQAQFGGTECPTTETSNCPFTNCPFDCEGQWGNWVACSNACGVEQKTDRQYTVNKEAQFGGIECPIIQTSNCPFTNCPVDCEGQWGNWALCSNNACGVEQKTTRQYIVNTQAQFGGTECPTTETSNCPFTNCPIDCKGEWSEWANCSEDCVNEETDEKPTTSRNYDITELEKHGGDCPLRGKIETSNCPFEYCPVDCEGEWSECAGCSNACGVEQFITRQYTVNKEAQFGGTVCLYSNGKIETSNCPFTNCPVDCDGTWGDWTPCSLISSEDDCRNGMGALIERNFNITTSNQFGGKDCPLPIETSNCSLIKDDCSSFIGNIGLKTEFTYNGSYVDVIPISTGWLDCVLVSGSGGRGGRHLHRGGMGVKLIAKLFVTKGKAIRIIVGNNAIDAAHSDRTGGPGGSGSAILMNNGDGWEPVLVAGGGGGGADTGFGGNAGMPDAPISNGAYGGTLSGGGLSIYGGRRAGMNGNGNNPLTGGNGGEGSARAWNIRYVGPFGYGKGGDSWYDAEDGGGGGGGGGYTGGGGGGGNMSGNGGGGGSSFVHSNTNLVEWVSWENINSVTFIKFSYVI